MSKRKTVEIDVDFIQPKIKSVCRSYTVFCEKMGRPNQRTWVYDWGRNKNLPSPEEAAKMCEILSVEPQDILVRPEDITLVQSIIDEKKPATADGDELDQERIKLLLSKMSVSDLQALMGDIASEMAGRAKE